MPIGMPVAAPFVADAFDAPDACGEAPVVVGGGLGLQAAIAIAKAAKTESRVVTCINRSLKSFHT